MLRTMALTTCALLAGGCSASENIEAADKQVGAFHTMLDAGKLDAIYDGASPEFKQAATKPHFVEFLGAVHRKLGAVKSSKRVGFNVNFAPEGTKTSVQYATEFASGPAAEMFVYRDEGGKPLLVGYNINSDALITR